MANDTSTRATWYTMGYVSACPFEKETAYGESSTRYPATLSVSGGLAIHATAPLVPWRGTLPQLNIGFHGGTDYDKQVNLPNAVIISGLNCNLLAGNGPEYNLGIVAAATSRGKAASQQADLTVQCSGTNEKADNVPLSMSIQFDPGPGMDPSPTDGFKLTATGQPGFYGTIGREDQETGCDKALTLGEPDPTPVHTYSPGETGQTDTAHYVFSLCRTGKPQDPGDYNMTLIATLVNV